MTIREGLDWLLDTDITDLIVYVAIIFSCLYLIGMILSFLSLLEEHVAVRKRKAEGENKEKLLENMRSRFPELSPEELTERVEREEAREVIRNSLLFFGLCIFVLIVLFSAGNWI